jgi:hypothetical protein
MASDRIGTVIAPRLSRQVFGLLMTGALVGSLAVLPHYFTLLEPPPSLPIPLWLLLIVGRAQSLVPFAVAIGLGLWVGRWWRYLATALLFTGIHLPARLLGGGPLTQAPTYAAVQLLPMASLFGETMAIADHAAVPTLLHLAWNWTSIVRGG